IPAVVKRTEGSLGMSEEEGIILCPLFSKNFRNFCLISCDCILNIVLIDISGDFPDWFFDEVNGNQNKKHQNGGGDGQSVEFKSGGYADAGGDPESRGGSKAGQSRTMENNRAGSQKSDADD